VAGAQGASPTGASSIMDMERRSFASAALVGDTPAMPISTLVVEDDAFTRVTLAESLRAQGVEVVLATAAAGEALELARERPLHAAFLDLHLGAGPTGIDLALALRRMHPRIGLVLLTTFDDPRLLSPTLPAPPPGTQYVTKRSISGVDRLIVALRAAAGVDRHAGRDAPSGREGPLQRRDRASPRRL